MRPSFDPDDVDRDGFTIATGVLATHETDRLKAAFGGAGDVLRRRNGAIFGMRNLLDIIPAIQALSTSGPLLDLVAPLAGDTARPVRALLFDKAPGANWPVLWHQDLTIAVSARRDIDGWGPWTVKAGIVHVKPPEKILQAMVSVRLHLDDCTPDNGPLLALPRTHKLGRLSRDRIDHLRRTEREHPCLGPRRSSCARWSCMRHRGRSGQAIAA
jgi:Phytanoyl-CoA dioxygenase (PhyH)